MSPVYDPDAEPPAPDPWDLIDGILKGFTRCRSKAFLREFAGRWATEIQASGRREEVEAAYQKRMREL